MPLCQRSVRVLVLLGLCLVPSLARAQAEDADYQAERQKASLLYSQNKMLEALPLLEDLAKKNPKDHEVLVALAACLTNHSATIVETDRETAKEELSRAKDLLQKAKELGDDSVLMHNLLQLLQGLPETGQIQYSSQPAVDQVLRAGDAAFAKRDFDLAIKNYSRALDLHPKNYSAALFIGDSYFASKNFPRAAEWYERASEIDPDIETAYRYYADMLTKNGDMKKAREMVIQAVVAEPYNSIPWRALQQWAQANHVELVRVHINVPDNVLMDRDSKVTGEMETKQAPDASSVWTAYGLVKMKWQGQEFKRRFPQEKEYRHTFAEESEALLAAALVIVNENKESATAPKDPDLALLLKLYQADAIQPYVLLSAADEGIAQDYAAFREKRRGALVEYLDRFVVPPTPTKN